MLRVSPTRTLRPCGNFYRSIGRRLDSSLSTDDDSSALPGQAGPVNKSSTQGQPWYVREIHKKYAVDPALRTDELPELPNNSPELLEPIVRALVDEMGIRDLAVIDARDTASLPGIMIVGTGSSPKHLSTVAQDMVSLLKRKFGVLASTEGILTANFVRVHNRRQQRRAVQQRWGARQEVPIGRADPWVVLDTHSEIFVHLMTAERRGLLDLETLFKNNEGNQDLTGDNSNFISLRKPIMAQRRGFHTLPQRRSAAVEKFNELLRHGDASEAALNEFFNLFGSRPTAEEWKLLLGYASVAAQLGDEPLLQRLVDTAREQQASGYVLDDEDLEVVLTGIAYHGQPRFSGLKADDEMALASWHALCDAKARAILDVHTFACHSVGRMMVTKPRMMVLLFRCFVAPSLTSVTPDDAVASPDRQLEVPRVFWDYRLKPLREIVEDSGALQVPSTLIMLLTTVANGGSWNTFWRLVDAARLGAVLNAQLLEMIVALVVRSGEREQIMHAIQTFVPTLMMQYNLKMSPPLHRAIVAGLEILDPTGEKYAALRQILNHSRAPLDSGSADSPDNMSEPAAEPV